MHASTRQQLRAALWDACVNCDECGGSGQRFVVGGTVTCGLCGPWRRTLRDTVAPHTRFRAAVGKRWAYIRVRLARIPLFFGGDF